MQWINNWPVTGIDKDGGGKGEPVLTYKKPLPGKRVANPATSEEFNKPALGLQWQWQANPKATWKMPFPNKGVMRLFSAQLPDSFRNYWDVPNLLLQKFPADSFTVTTKCSFTPNPKLEGEHTGLIIMGTS